jgi:type IV pilus assembly protein PilW
MVDDCSAAGSTGNSSIWVPIATNVVSLRAEYARDTSAPMNATVDTYDQTALASACDIAKVSAIRLALVVRSANYEKTVVTTDNLATDPTAILAPTWEGATVQTGAFTNPTAVVNDLTGIANWKNYRYRVFQSTVPIRTVAWQGVQSGC